MCFAYFTVSGTACENIQPSISPCEVDYNKVIEFESRPDESHYCLNRGADSQKNSSGESQYKCWLTI